MSKLDPYMKVIEELYAQGKSAVQIAQHLNTIGCDAGERIVQRAVKNMEPGEVEVDVSAAARIEVLEAELTRARRLLADHRKRESADSMLVEAIERSLANATILPMPEPVALKEGPGEPQEMVVYISDAHYGEVVDPAQAMGLEYDPDIARSRLQYIAMKVVRWAQLRRTSYPIKKLTVAVLGDMLSGNIHEELEITNAMVMVDQVVEMAEELTAFLATVAAYFPEVECIIVPGNHPRTKKKPSAKNRYDSWEYLMGKMVQAQVAAGFYHLPEEMGNVTVKVPRDIIYIHEVAGHRIAMYHGDGIKSNSFAGLPFYGMKQQETALQKLCRDLGIPPVDRIAMGHFHQHMSWYHAGIMVNGSIKGGDEFSLSRYMSFHKPMQVIEEYHPKHGLTCTDYIDLSNVQ